MNSISRRDALRVFTLAGGALALPGWRRLSAAEPTATPAAPSYATAALAPGVTLLTGAGGNIIISSGGDGGVVIDSGIPDAAITTAAQIAKAAPRLTLLVNTHWHFDHAGGNEQLARAGARIVATENCRHRLASEQYLEALDRRFPPSPRTALPAITFTHETGLALNDETFRLVPLAPAHTDGDALVRLEKANVLHLGDVFFHGMYPFIDYSSGGWIGGMIAGVKAALPLVDTETQIVPGHGPVAKLPELQKYLGFLETIHERLAQFKAAGKSVEEVLAAAPTKEFDATLGGGVFKTEQFVRFAYTGLLRHE